MATIEMKTLKFANDTNTYKVVDGDALHCSTGGTIQGNVNIRATTTIADDIPAHLGFRVTQTDNDVTYTGAYIQFHDDLDADNYGGTMIIKSGGNMVIGAGESPATCYSTDLVGNTSENMYITSDSVIYFYTNCNTYDNHVSCAIGKDGAFTSKALIGDAIRYQTTEPTGTVTGQIWLKPVS